MRSKEYLVAVRPQEEILALETMYFADEIRDPIEGTGYEPSGQPAKPRELAVARQLIESMTTDWDPARYEDTYRERVEQLIESKRNGEEIETAAPAPRASKVVDLTETLRRSVEEARGRTGGRSGAPAGAAAQGSKASGAAEGSKAPRATGRSGPQGEDLSAMTKAQLAALAAELGIPGRSKLTRDELETAVRQARHPRPKAVS
jgi:DNA end-binding protein Ku